MRPRRSYGVKGIIKTNEVRPGLTRCDECERPASSFSNNRAYCDKHSQMYKVGDKSGSLKTAGLDLTDLHRPEA
jgi:hypothetical protein